METWISLLLLLVTAAQVHIVAGQRRQQLLARCDNLRNRWNIALDEFGFLIYLGREPDAYYQTALPEQLKLIGADISSGDYATRPVSAIRAAETVFGLMDELCWSILTGQLTPYDAYQLLGARVLRNGRALRTLLEAGYSPASTSEDVQRVRSSIQEWLIYHDGIRRRSLITIDLLWAQAVKLTDLPPGDIIKAAEAKATTGDSNRRRMSVEFHRVSEFDWSMRRRRLMRLLRNAEFRRRCSKIGVHRAQLEEEETTWVSLLLRADNAN